MKKSFLFFVIIFSFVFADNVSAQGRVPSIPRRNQSSTTTTSHEVAWGTPYDWLSTRYATYNDIRNYDKGQIRVLKNSIYARHGRKFKDRQLKAYFESQSWYKGRYNEVPAKYFNKYENANIAFLKKYE